jgi:hypothetical protein
VAELESVSLGAEAAPLRQPVQPGARMQGVGPGPLRPGWRGTIMALTKGGERWSGHTC